MLSAIDAGLTDFAVAIPIQVAAVASVPHGVTSRVAFCTTSVTTSGVGLIPERSGCWRWHPAFQGSAASGSARG